jgi:predicted transcriptional regulator of viral defense system
MIPTITGLSPREAELLSWLAGAERFVFRLEEVQQHWAGVTSAARTLSRLEQGGWLKRIERGLYMLVPLEAGPDRAWTQDSLVIGSRLATPAAIAYWSALRFWNLTGQVPRTVFVHTPCRKARASLTFEGVVYRIIHINTARFFGLTTSSANGQQFHVTDREKSILDAMDRPELCGGIRHIAQGIARESTALDWDRLDSYADRFRSGAVLKRLGYVIETLGIDTPDGAERLRRWQSRLSEGIADLDPGEPGRGVVRRRWRIRDRIGLATEETGFKNDLRG